MNTELFIANKLFFDRSNRKMLSQRIIRIALFGIALGLSVMIVSVAVITGFKTEVRNKVFGFAGNIQIVNFNAQNSFERPPISRDQPFLNDILKIDGIKNIQVYGTKPGMIKTEEYIQGIVFKGVDTEFDWSFFEKNLVAGQLPEINDSVRINEIIISEKVANLLEVGLNDLALLYFINENERTPRLLQLKVCGIYRTGMEEFDNLFVLGDLKQIQRLNNWEKNEISGFEILVNDFREIDEIEQQVRSKAIFYTEDENSLLRTESIMRNYPQIFDWLDVLDMNVWVILILMILVAGFNMMSGLLVLILERSKMIGVLKAMGSNNWNIRKIFLYLSMFLTSRGMLWGNVIGILFIVIQKLFHVIKLNPETYYVDVAPVNFSITHILLLNIGTLVITTLMLIIPSYWVSKISPEKSIRFD
ncbi:MAG: ABC transporter permease [Prolixibacteraceae bacterium]|nr:ABC transporter permease [Prolixibacteraceae bacterium]